MDVRLEDAGISYSSDGNAVTSVAPIDAIVPHPESFSWTNEAHPRPESNEESDRVLRGAQWVANNSEPQTPYDRNRRLLFHIHELMGIVRLSQRTEDLDTSTSQAVCNDSDTSVESPRASPSVRPISFVRSEGDSGTFSRGGGGFRRAEGGRHLALETLRSVGRHAESRDSKSWIHDFAISHPKIYTSVPFRPPPPGPHNRATCHGGDALANHYQTLQSAKEFRHIIVRQDVDVHQLNLAYVR